MTGKLTVFTGCMFARKSTELQRQGERHELAGRAVVYVKPSIDGRYGDDVVATHNGEKKPAIQVETDSNEVLHMVGIPDVQEADVVCIDEVQFFPTAIITAIKFLVDTGRKVYVSGLDMDKDGVPFEVTMRLMAMADDVQKFHAVCTDCGDDAVFSYQTVQTDTRVTIGNDYTPLCRSCYRKKKQGVL